MRVAALGLIAACLLVGACNPSAPGAAFPDLDQTAYRLEATIANPSGASMPVVMIRDGDKMRLEFNAPQGQSTILSDGASGESYILSSVDGRLTAIRATGLNQQFTNPVDAWRGELAQSATQSGPCSAAGQTGVEWSRDNAGVVNTVCVTADGIVLRAAEGGRTVWETTRIERGPQSADQFALPPGVEVVDLGRLGEALNDALQHSKAGAGE